MATTCISEITADLISGDWMSYLFASTAIPVPLDFAPGVRQKILLSTSKQESIICNLFIEVTTLVNVTFYKINDDGISATNVGGVTASDNNTTFQKDLTPGTYILCFTSIYAPVLGSFTATYSGFITETRFYPRARAGEMLLATLKTRPVDRICREPFYFTFIDGVLPPGCTFRPDGIVYGPLPNLDCNLPDVVPEVYIAYAGEAMLVKFKGDKDPPKQLHHVPSTYEWSPSINWFYEGEKKQWRPIPKRWQFRARVTMVNFPTVYAEENFSIDIYNDWSKDRDAFMKNADKGFDREREIVVDTPKPTLDRNQFVLSVSTPDTRKKEIKPVVSSCCGDNKYSRDLEFMSWYINEYAAVLSKDVKLFVEKFKETNRFKDILGTSSINISVIDGIINSSISSLRSVEDVDYLFLEVGKRLNSLMPYEALGYTDTKFSVEVKW